MNLFVCKPWGIVLVYYLTNSRNMSIFNADGLNMFLQYLCSCFCVAILLIYLNIYFCFCNHKAVLIQETTDRRNPWDWFIDFNMYNKKTATFMSILWWFPLPSHNVKWRTQSINIKIEKFAWHRKIMSFLVTIEPLSWEDRGEPASPKEKYFEFPCKMGPLPATNRGLQPLQVGL